jgi:hypothetical protein
LRDFSAALTTLWNLDSNRLEPGGVNYKLDVQGKASYSSRRDAAKKPLFSKNPLDKEHFHDEIDKRPTFDAFYKLLNNYEAETGVKEVVTSVELAEQSRFLDRVCNTTYPKATTRSHSPSRPLSVDFGDPLHAVL